MPTLPIDPLLPQLQQLLRQHDELVLEAPPGAGKTTRVPLALLDEPWLGAQKIIMLEPRRLAARSAAAQLARQLGERVGEQVGYRVRLDSCVGPATRIEVVTEGILTRMLQQDPCLDGVGLLIFDEFHERSLDADLGLALALQGRELLREGTPLKLLLMSATLDGAAIAQLLGSEAPAPLLSSAGRSFPVREIYCGAAEPGAWIEPRVARIVEQALAEQSGSLLVFLPGQREIRRVTELLQPLLAQRDDLLLAPLYGDLSLQQQQAAIAPAPQGQRKIVLATAIAETSLTIEGIAVVIDSGLSRQARFDPASGMTRLHTSRVSAASATQRAGRAGRLAPGVCYRLWSAGQQQQLTPFTPPEMLQADLAPLALQLLRWGVNDPTELRWLDPPPRAAFAQACDLLLQLGAATRRANGQLQLSPHGERMAQLPAHPRLSHLLLRGAELGLGGLACDLAALLSERDPLPDASADIQLRLAWLKQRPAPGSRTLQQHLQQLSRQFRQQCDKLPDSPASRPPFAGSDTPAASALLLALAYPERIARNRSGEGGTHYRLSQGRGAVLAAGDPLTRQPWLAVAQLSSRSGDASDRIQLAAALDPALFDDPRLAAVLGDLVSVAEQVEWDPQQQRLIAERQRRIGALVLSREPLPQLDPQQRSRALLDLVRRKGLGLLPFDAEIDAWRARVRFVREHSQDPAWPDLSDAALLDTLELWLAPWLDDVSHINHFAKLPLPQMLQALLPWPLPQQLDELAPQRIAVPSGARHAIDYRESPPVLAVKLQEMFGCSDTPSIGFGVRLKLHLLSPARRPLQVTQDLAGFWRNVYGEVKKEMKGRYPKHPWPDDPLQAPATARTKKHSGH